jgi:uncharacterized protein DUF1524
VVRTFLLPALTLAALLGALLTAAPATAATTTARALLSKLTVRAEAGSTTYSKTSFKWWIDADHDGCNTRAEVLIVESRVRVTPGAGCRITRGKWYSWYDGKTWTLASDVDIDHVVALKETWKSGARSWTAANRQRYANDLDFSWTLDAVTDDVNASKGDRDPTQWLPALSKCTYAIHWVAVKYRWRLTVDSAERAKLASLLSGSCGARTLTIPARAI